MGSGSIWGELFGVPLRQHYVPVQGIRTRVVEAGEGEPLVFVHGTAGHLEAYARNFAELSGQFRVVTYDMMGHGLTDKPDRPYTIDVLSEHLVGLLEALGTNDVYLSGESLGGWVAAWTAAHHPGVVRKLVLNTPGNITNKPAVMTKVKESSLLAAREPTTANVRSRLEWLFLDPSFVTDELVSIRQRVYSQQGFARAMENIVALQDPEIRKAFAWDPAWCGQIRCPTLLLWTDNDPTGGLDEADLLLEWIPGSRLEVIRGAGHWPQWEKPEEFHRAHIDFLLSEE
ncbi:MAG: alpha/beta hydrolase [Actinomycetota bacterium]|jgi:2-hydroxy-6-oxonona-2,4-dienedioate hydrolase|nr:alpha/beta hydrolase [Actinomycetota bacterium]MDA8077292.1 alpha/beta hydrolase [Actinomycetota bacterium]